MGYAPIRDQREIIQPRVLKFAPILGAFLLLAVGLMFLSPSVTLAKSTFPKGYERDKGKEISVSDPLGWPISVKTSSYTGATIDSLPEMAVVRLSPYNPWWRFWRSLPATTTVIVSGLPKNTSLHIYTNGYREHQVEKTDSKGTLSLYFSSKPGIQYIIKSQPSTIRIAIDPLFGPPGGDCSNVGVWDAALKKCTLTQNVGETIAIEDDSITLDGDGHNLTGPGTGDGVYVDVANATVKNLSVSNFARGVVYSAPFSLFSKIGRAHV